MEIIPAIQILEDAKRAIEKGSLEIAFQKVKRCFAILKVKNVDQENRKFLEKNFILLSGQFHLNNHNGNQRISSSSEVGYSSILRQKGQFEMELISLKVKYG